MSRDLDELYADWWTRVPLDAYAYSDELDDPEDVEFHPQQEWEMVAPDAEGGLVVARAGEVGSLRPGEWLACRASRILSHRRHRWAQGGFDWAASSRPAPLTARRWRVRVYIPGWAQARSEFERIASALEDAGYWFEAKTLRATGCSRSDHSVFWLAAGDAITASRLIASLSPHRADRPLPPPLASPLAAIGLAHDPARGASFGRRVCAAIISAGDHDDQLTVSRRWGSACERFAILPDRPWRHPGELDPYRIWERLEHESE